MSDELPEIVKASLRHLGFRLSVSCLSLFTLPHWFSLLQAMYVWRGDYCEVPLIESGKGG